MRAKHTGRAARHRDAADDRAAVRAARRWTHLEQHAKMHLGSHLDVHVRARSRLHWSSLSCATSRKCSRVTAKIERVRSECRAASGVAKPCPSNP